MRSGNVRASSLISRNDVDPTTDVGWVVDANLRSGDERGASTGRVDGLDGVCGENVAGGNGVTGIAWLDSSSLSAVTW